MWRTAVSWLLTGTLLLGNVQVAVAQTPEQKASARSFAQRGAEAFEAERWEEAIDWFERAERLVHAPTHLLYLARAQRKLGRLVESRETYLALRRETLPETTPTVFAEAQASGEEEFSEVDPLVPTLTVQVTGSGAAQAEVTIDGKPIDAALVGAPRPINPGTYRVQARSGAAESQVQEVSLTEGEHKEITVELVGVSARPEPVAVQADSGSSGSNIPAYVAFGVGAVGVGLGVVFLVQRSSQDSEANDLFAGCERAGSCSNATIEKIDSLDGSAATSGTLSAVSFGVGAAGLGAGLVLLLLNGGEPEAPATGASIRPYASFDRVGFTGTF